MPQPRPATAPAAEIMGEDYSRLLESVFLLHRLPAWGSTLSGRVNRLPKVHLVDTGLGGWLLGITARGISRRVSAVLAEFGPVSGHVGDGLHLVPVDSLWQSASELPALH